MRSKIRPLGCDHLDWPCCGCGYGEVLTGTDMLAAIQEDEDLMYLRDPNWDDRECDCGECDCGACNGDERDDDDHDGLFEHDTPFGQELDSGYDDY